MISVPGKITVRAISGRNGSFNVGTLDCSLGSFTVKDATIEEFDEGIYEGDFVIDKIKPSSYFTGGRLVVEIRATLSAIMIAKHAIPAPVQPESLEQDPLVEDLDNCLQSPPLPIPFEVDERGEIDDDQGLERLFGALWPLGSVIKLDPTVGRGVLRQQCDYLKQSGYKYDAPNLTWKRGAK
jgi:hypothetical protein